MMIRPNDKAAGKDRQWGTRESAHEGKRLRGCY